MPAEMIVKILHDVSRWAEPLNEIIPVNYGEFFMRKDWLWILKMIESKLPHTRIVIPTNGTLLTAEVVKQLCQIQTVDIINFSINAYYDETYRAFMQLPPEKLRQVEHSIELIKATRADISLRASMVFDPSWCTDYERDLFMLHWKEQGVEPWVNPAASACRGVKILKPTLIPCRSIFSDIVIGYDGRLSLCCFDASFKLELGKWTGNLLEDWKNPQIQALRETHNTHKRINIELCRGCSFA